MDWWPRRGGLRNPGKWFGHGWLRMVGMAGVIGVIGVVPRTINVDIHVIVDINIHVMIVVIIVPDHTAVERVVVVSVSPADTDSNAVTSGQPHRANSQK